MVVELLELELDFMLVTCDLTASSSADFFDSVITRLGMCLLPLDELLVLEFDIFFAAILLKPFVSLELFVTYVLICLEPGILRTIYKTTYNLCFLHFFCNN
ncbi:hypothetical protein H131_04854 [Lysinibacillus sphaericus OT4b.31]|uniref:Uncharacterized protein n=1 Tax=Lysinibacillus sphaericus OT4b.31 TaxID=1285586 RepID=R7ZIU8_LYSSH|nr:hypothetical protein H131_04854 [Lysinibacillus sphaericus OT4b.31]